MSSRRAPGRRRGGRHSGERGSGLLGAVLGLGITLALLGLAVNLALGLWTRSTVDSIAYDAARHVATAPAGAPTGTAQTEALTRARQLLGRHGERVELSFEHRPGDPVVVLRVRSPGVTLMPRLVDGGPTVGALDRRIVVRREGPA